jgi:hypothetical protein
MNKKPPIPRQQHVPVAPEPSSASAAEGVESGQDLACRYWRNLVRLHAAIALSPDSAATLHTKMLSAKEIRELAGGIPQAAPEPPQGESGNGGSPPP